MFSRRSPLCFWRSSAADSAFPPPQKSASAASTTRKAASKAASDGSVVVCIDGQPLTRRDVVRNGKVMLTLNMNKMRRTKIGKKDWEYLSRYCAEAAKREVGRAAVRRYLADHRLTPDSNVVARLTRAFARRYGVKSKKLKRWHTVDDLKYMLGTNAFRVDAEIRDRVDYATVTNAILAANPVVVTEPMIQKRLKEIADYNARAEATNAVVFARATNVWQKIVGKEITFEDAAKAYSEDAYLAYGCEWGLFTREQLSDEAEVLKLLPTLKVGDVTPPVESDGGLAILRMDASDDPDNVAFLSLANVLHAGDACRGAHGAEGGAVARTDFGDAEGRGFQVEDRVSGRDERLLVRRPHADGVLGVRSLNPCLPLR